MTNGKILATVGGKAITDMDVDNFIASLGQRGAQYNSPQGRAAILEQLINDRLFLLDANRNLMSADPAFKAELERAKESLLVSFAVEKVIAAVKVTDADAEKYYNENKEQFATGEEVTASHILVKEEAEANTIAEAIKAGSISFEDAAKQKSQCPSGQQGGSLGRFGKGQMVPEFDEACFSMEVGELRYPIKTDFGYHIIRLDARHEAGCATLQECLPQIKATLLNEKQKAAYQSKVNQMKILYPVDKF